MQRLSCAHSGYGGEDVATKCTCTPDGKWPPWREDLPTSGRWRSSRYLGDSSKADLRAEWPWMWDATWGDLSLIHISEPTRLALI
eukprot:6228607-Alexandrium_andersonii.AAC.1